MKRLVLFVASALTLGVGACDLSRQEVAPQVEPHAERGVRVFIVEETADRPRLPANQQAIFASVPLRQYLKAHCVTGPDGAPAFRIIDKDAELTGDWRATLRAHPPRSYPWLYVSNGKSGYSGPLPNSVDELISLIKPYADRPK